MNNDLLFPILPRNGKVPIKSDNKITRIKKEASTKQLSDEEKEMHAEERRANLLHQINTKSKQTDDKDNTPDSKNEQIADDSDNLTYDEHGEIDKLSQSEDDKPDEDPHFDITV